MIDELEEDVIVVVAARWPRLDALGRLRFLRRNAISAMVTLQDLSKVVSRDRDASEDRTLRIGDAFLVRGVPPSTDAQLAKTLSTTPPWDWGALITFIDVTASARDAAKAALFAAAAPRMAAHHAEDLGLVERTVIDRTPDDEPPPSAPAAAPVV